MKTLTTINLVAAALLAGACSGKAPVSDELADLAGADAKADFVAAKLKVVGSIDGLSSMTLGYTSKPKYRAVSFTADPGQLVTIRVVIPKIPVGTTPGDPVTWLTDASFHTLAMNDDASASDTTSLIQATLPANRPARSHTYYVVLRNYDWTPASFAVSVDKHMPLSGDLATQAREFYDASFSDLIDTGHDVDYKVPASSLPAAAKARYAAEKAYQGNVNAYRFQVAGKTIYVITNSAEEIFWVTIWDSAGHFLDHGFDGDSGPSISSWDTREAPPGM